MADETKEALNDFAFSLSTLAAPLVYLPGREEIDQKTGYLILADGTFSPEGIAASMNLGKPGGKATTEQKKTYLETHPQELLILAAVNDPVIRETSIDSSDTRYNLFSFVEPHLSNSRFRLAQILAKKTAGSPTETESLQIKIMILDKFQNNLLIPASPNRSPGRVR